MSEEKFSTTFRMDFTIADRFGIPAIRDTFNRAFSEWKSDYRYLTDLVITLNHKIWEHYETRPSYAEVYNELWELLEHLKDIESKRMLRRMGHADGVH